MFLNIFRNKWMFSVWTENDWKAAKYRLLTDGDRKNGVIWPKPVGVWWGKVIARKCFQFSSSWRLCWPWRWKIKEMESERDRCHRFVLLWATEIMPNHSCTAKQKRLIYMPLNQTHNHFITCFEWQICEFPHVNFYKKCIFKGNSVLLTKMYFPKCLKYF